jgi:hypothetical protein
VYNVLEAATAVAPELTNSVIRDALTTFVSRGLPTPKSSTAGDEQPSALWNKHSRLSALLLSAVAFKDDVDPSIRENSIVKLIVLGHHPLICPYVNSLPFSSHSKTFRWISTPDLDRPEPESGNGPS